MKFEIVLYLVCFPQFDSLLPFRQDLVTARSCDACDLRASSYQDPHGILKVTGIQRVSNLLPKDAAQQHIDIRRGRVRDLLETQNTGGKINRRRAYDNPQLCSGAGDVTP